MGAQLGHLVRGGCTLAPDAYLFTVIDRAILAEKRSCPSGSSLWSADLQVRSSSATRVTSGAQSLMSGQRLAVRKSMSGPGGPRSLQDYVSLIMTFLA